MTLRPRSRSDVARRLRGQGLPLGELSTFLGGLYFRGKMAYAAASRLRRPTGFTGRSPGGPSRWSTERSGEWEPLKPVLVAEVAYDHFTGGRFRHGTGFLRWRPDKAPAQCTFDQVQRRAAASLLGIGSGPSGPR